jgi:hypothetical protein
MTTKTSIALNLLLAVATGFLFVRNARLEQDLRNSRIDLCIANLERLDIVKEEWASENKKGPGDNVSLKDLIRPHIESLSAKPRWKAICPSGGTYTIGSIGSPPKCSIAEHNKMPVWGH